MYLNYDSVNEMLEGITEDVLKIYNECKSSHIITDSVPDVRGYVHDFTTEVYKRCPHVGLFIIKDRYSVALTCIGISLEGAVWKRNAIMNYADKFILEIYDSRKDDSLSGHPFNEMDIDGIIEYLKTGSIDKSSGFKFRYDLIKEGNVVYSLYGANNEVVKRYFTSFGAKNVRASRGASSRESLYTMTKDGQEYKFLVRRSTL